MVSTIKFSEFVAADLNNSTNKSVGLSGGLNAQTNTVVRWTSATRPATPFDGLLGYNITLTAYEFWNASTLAWTLVGGGGTGSVTLINTGTGLTGGPITTTGSISFAPIAAASFWANTTAGVAVPTVVPLASLVNLILPSTTTSRQMLQSVASANPVWSTSIWPDTTVQNQILYSPANNVVSQIPSANNSVLITDGSAVPSLSAILPQTVQTNITRLGAQAQALNMSNHQINNVTDPTNSQDAATLAYVTSQTTGMFLPLIGGTMQGIINMGNHKITNLTDPSASQDAVTINYLNAQLAFYLPLSGGTMTGAINMGSKKITNLLDPTNPQDAATKNYVDLVATGLTVQPACYAATTANLTATYLPGASGIGATLTNSGALVAFTTDGTTPPTNARILVWQQSSTLQNGIYNLTNQGSGAVAWILTRATDYDQPAEIQPGDFVIINNGTLYGGSSFIETASVAAVGTDPILFSQFTFSASAVLLKVNNLSDVANTTTAFNNISPLTTKGDLIGYSTQNIRVPVGATNNQILQVSSASVPGIAWSTATYPSSTTINQILYSSATNTVTGISSLAGGVLVTNNLSVPQMLTNPGAVGKVLQSANAAIPTWSTAVYPSVSGTSGNVLTSDGTNWISSPSIGTGTVNSGLINQLAYYAASGTTVSGLPTANNAGLLTNASGVPAWVTTTGTGSIVLNVNPTINMPKINKILDFSTGAVVHEFSAPAGSVNLVKSVGSTTGNPIGFQFDGTDTNVSAAYTTKGTGAHIFFNNLAGTESILLSISGSASSVNHVNITSGAIGVSPIISVSGTDTNIGININSKGTGRVAIQGVSTNTAAPAGYVGEFVSSIIPEASSVSFTTGVSKDLTSISLTAGDWDVTGNIFFTPTGISLANGSAWISTTSATQPNKSLYNIVIFPLVTGSLSLNAPSVRLLLSATTTVYLSGNVTATTPTGCGGIYARRCS